MTNQDSKAVAAAIHDLQCPECETTSVVTRMIVDRFQYGDGDDSVELEATVPLRVCENCGFEYFDEAAESARHEAVCKHLKRLPPRLITAGREYLARACGCKVSRAEFARVSRLGLASLNRWESGGLIQTAAYDLLLRLLLVPANYEQVRSGAIYDIDTEWPQTSTGTALQHSRVALPRRHTEAWHAIGGAQLNKWKTPLSPALREMNGKFQTRRCRVLQRAST